MSADQWLDLLGKAGWPVAGIIALAYFLARHVWPFVVKQIEVTQSAREAQSKEFLEALRRRDVLAEESHKQNLEALHKISSDIALLRSEVMARRT